MMRDTFIIARKEVFDHIRDRRSILAAAMHLLMGPAIVFLVSLSMAGKSSAKTTPVLAGMVIIFALIAGFIGGMNIAMDMVAGERERRSLLPLLLNPVSRLSIILGKWLATAIFGVSGLAVTLIAFAVTETRSSTPDPLFNWPALLPWGVLGLLPLTGLAAALQLLISTACRTAKEAQTYLSLLIFVPMAIAMLLVFFPGRVGPWIAFVPIAGQQTIADEILTTGHWPVLQACGLAFATMCAAAGAIASAEKLLNREGTVYGT